MNLSLFGCSMIFFGNLPRVGGLHWSWLCWAKKCGNLPFRWIPDLVPDRIFVGISFQNKGEDNSKALVFPLPANQLPGRSSRQSRKTWGNQCQPATMTTNSRARPRPFTLFRTPMPSISAASPSAWCSSSATHALDWKDMLLGTICGGSVPGGTVATVTIFCSPGSNLERWIPKCWFSKKTWDDADPNRSKDGLSNSSVSGFLFVCWIYNFWDLRKYWRVHQHLRFNEPSMRSDWSNFLSQRDFFVLYPLDSWRVKVYPLAIENGHL